MSHVKVYDPAVCCSTGVCSPDADASIAQFSAALEKARKAGVTVDRFTLAHQPAEYVANTTIKSLLDTEGVDVLPVVMVDGEVLSKGDYPGRAALLSRLEVEDEGSAPAASSCCGPAEKTETGCC